MNEKIIPFLIIGLSAAFYHIGSKVLGKMPTHNLWQTLTLTYFMAFVISLICVLSNKSGLAFSELDRKSVV